MTAPNPEQMRALAARMARRRSVVALDAEVIATLRAAADQLEAVRAFAGQADLIWNVKPRVSDRLNSILTLKFEDNA